MISLPIHQFDIHNVFFNEQTYQQRLFQPETEFSKIFYSDPCMTLSTIYIDPKHTFDTYTDSTRKTVFVHDDHVFKSLQAIETNILQKYSSTINTKTNPTSIMNNREIKVDAFYVNNCTPQNYGKILFKISGVWANNSSYGITCKFVVLCPGFNRLL